MNPILDERDSLTGLASRRAGLAILHGSIEHNSQIALLLCDVDRLYAFNSAFGHERGDEELCRIARDLKWVCGLFPVSRFGGDEFAIVLPEVSLSRAREIAAEILASQPPLSVPLEGNSSVEALSLSIGIALFPLHATTDEKLFHAADIALLKAKRGGCFPDGFPYEGRNRAITWGDFLDEFPHQSAQFLNPV